MTHNRSDYIADGYTEAGYIAPVEGLHGELRFEYRPMLPEEQAALFSTVESMDPAKYKRKCGHELAGKLVSWNLIDAKGKAVEIKQVRVNGLRPAIFNRLFNIVTGIEPTDRDPEWNDTEADDATDDEYETAIMEKSNPQTIGQARADRHAGN